MTGNILRRESLRDRCKAGWANVVMLTPRAPGVRFILAPASVHADVPCLAMSDCSGSSSCPRRTVLAAFAWPLAHSSAAHARTFGPDAPPVRYPEPDVVVLDPRFAKYKLGNAPIERVSHGMLFAEGTAWNAVGQYLIWSDIPNNRQHRWLAEDGHTSVFRRDAGYSNGNTFDFQGRQLSCEHGSRSVVRYEHDGSKSVLASSFQGKRLNAPNDLVVHPNGDVWFTDPGYGSLMNYEGYKGALELKEAVYRIDAQDGTLHKVTDEIVKPNGLCFSPDYQKLYVADSGATHVPSTPKHIKVWDIMDTKKLAKGRAFASMMYKGKGAFADGIRADVDGNIYASTGWVGDGYDGVHVFAPNGERIGLIRLPETAGNLCFGGPRRNRLFIAASASIYAVYLETQGAHIT